MRLIAIQRNQFACSHTHYSDEADNEHECADEAKHVHGLHAKSTDEPEADEVEKTVHKAVHAHEFAHAVLSCLMAHTFLPNFGKSRIFG